MRGYPNGMLNKTDYDNLLSMPLYRLQASLSLLVVSCVDDSKVTCDIGTPEVPNIVLITNPLPCYKRIGFATRKLFDDYVAAAQKSCTTAFPFKSVL